MIKIAYMVDAEPGYGTLLRLTGYDYYRHAHGWAHGSNKSDPSQPYNYFEELLATMQQIGYDQLLESVWEIHESSLCNISRRMAAAGFILVPVEE